MLHKLNRLINGYFIINISGDSLERFMNMCSYHNIDLWNVINEEKGIWFNISKIDYEKLDPILKKTKTEISNSKSVGVPFIILRMKKRPFQLIGIFITITLIYFYSLLLWDIQLKGNERYSDEEVYNFLNEIGINKLMSIKNIDCDKIVYTIRNNFDEIIWVSVHIEGNNLSVNIKENSNYHVEELEDGKNLSYQEEIGYDIVAKTEGVIDNIITRNGTAQVNVGDQVEKGDILVSGEIIMRNDSQEIIGYKYIEADADVYIRSEVIYEDKLELHFNKKMYEESTKNTIYLKVWDYYIGGIEDSDPNKEIISEEFSLDPTKQNLFSIKLGLVTVRDYMIEEGKYTENEISLKLSSKFNRYKDELFEKGVEIIENNVKIELDENFAYAKGELIIQVNNTTKEKTIVNYLPEENIEDE